MTLPRETLSPQQRYQQDLLRDDFVADAAQQQVVDALQALYDSLLPGRPAGA